MNVELGVSYEHLTNSRSTGWLIYNLNNIFPTKD